MITATIDSHMPIWYTQNSFTFQYLSFPLYIPTKHHLCKNSRIWIGYAAPVGAA